MKKTSENLELDMFVRGITVSNQINTHIEDIRHFVDIIIYGQNFYSPSISHAFNVSGILNRGYDDVKKRKTNDINIKLPIFIDIKEYENICEIIKEDFFNDYETEAYKVYLEMSGRDSSDSEVLIGMNKRYMEYCSMIKYFLENGNSTDFTKDIVSRLVVAELYLWSDNMVLPTFWI